jgi:hypothetical protein
VQSTFSFLPPRAASGRIRTHPTPTPVGEAFVVT